MKLQQAIHQILCDTTIFPVGTSLYCAGIVKKVQENPQLRKDFPDASDENIYHHTSKLLEVHHNAPDNNYTEDYHHKREIIVDTTNPRRYLYTFGELL